MESLESWIVAHFEFGGVMQVTEGRLRALPLFKGSIPRALRLDDSTNTKRRRSDHIVLPYIQSESELYDLTNEHRYDARNQTNRPQALCAVFTSRTVCPPIAPGCIDGSLRAKHRLYT